MSLSRTVSEIFSVKEWRYLETGDMGRSRSLKMAPFDRSYTTFYWSAIVSIALRCTISKLYDVEWVEVTQDHSNWYHSKAWMRFHICLA